MDCREFQGYIIDRLLGEKLPDSVERELASHLSGCEDCRRRELESRRVWSSLQVLDTVHFPSNLSRRVLAEVRPRRRLSGILPLRSGWLVPAAAALVLAVGLVFLLGRNFPPGSDLPQVSLRSASTFSRQLISAPDLSETLDGYLEESEVVLSNLANGSYPTWGELFSELISRDIQGRSNYLLENPELGARARNVVGVLHNSFWTLLQAGRGREREPVELPPAVNPVHLLGEIDTYRSEIGGGRR